jgi:hypothetical protein
MGHLDMLTRRGIRTSIRRGDVLWLEPQYLVSRDVVEWVRAHREALVADIRGRAENASNDLPEIAPNYSILMVATNLDSWVADDPRFGYEVILDTCYRQLDRPYYAWLRHRMENARAAHRSGNLDNVTFNALRTKFNVIHAWAISHIGEEALKQAIRTTNVRRYIPPSEATFATYRRTLDEAWRSRSQPATVSHGDAKWNRMLASRGYVAVHSAVIDDIVVVVRDDTIVLPDAWANKVRFSLKELDLIVGSSREMVKQLCDVKRAFGGNVVPTDDYPFDRPVEAGKSGQARSTATQQPEHQQSLFAA